MLRSILVLVIAAAAMAAEPPVVLVTAFAPFAGRGVNGSRTLAEALPGSLPGVDIRVVVLGVRWGEPRRRIPEAAAGLRPVLVLGLGEGEDGQVAVEQVADNRCLDEADEAGARPPAARLEPDGPAERPARLRVDPAWAVPGLPLVHSRDAGGYLCNEALWAISALPAPAAGFIHVPPQGGEPDQAYRERLLPLLRAVIAGNLPPAR